MRIDVVDSDDITPGRHVATFDAPRLARWARSLPDHWRAYSVAVLLAGGALGMVLLTPGAEPSADAAYAPIGAALLIGALLSIRLRAGAPVTTLLLIPAVAAEARFGLAALPAVALAISFASLVRSARGVGLLTAVGVSTLAYAASDLAATKTGTSELMSRLAVFAAAFVITQVGLSRLAVWLGGPEIRDSNADRPEPILLFALAPLAVLPLLAGLRFGDGGLLLGLAALLAMLALVAEARNLATARAEAEFVRDRLARANALQRDLVHLITHELNNPLTSVLLYTQLAERALSNDQREKLPVQIERIHHAAKGLQGLVDNLLQLGRLEDSGELPPAEPIDLAALARAVEADLEPIAEQKHLVMRIQATQPTPTVLAPPLLLRQVLSNLLSNAIKYTPAHGEVLVWMRRQDSTGTVVLGVSDTGIGLSPEDLARLFKKFFRSADPRARLERGSGLGLALTNAIVTRIGGKIEVESQLNQGTTFRLTLPGVGR